MTRIAAFLSAHRVVLGPALAGLLVAATTAPTAAWQADSPNAALLRAEALPATSHPHVPPVDSREEALAAGGRRAPGARARTVIREGIDVSHWQGRIDWGRVARSGIDFAIAKATEGTWMVDPWYERNRGRAQRAGIRFTAYHYANPGPGRGDAIREADWFLKHAGLRGHNLLPALDLEESGGLTPAQLRRWTLTWMRRVERKLGVKPMLYTSPGFWGGAVGNTRRVAEAGFEVLWVSHWYTNRPAVPARRWAGAGWTIWQWTDSGRVSGVPGWVDRNIYSGPRLRKMTIKEIRRDGRPDRPPADEQGGNDRPRRPAPR